MVRLYEAKDSNTNGDSGGSPVKNISYDRENHMT